MNTRRVLREQVGGVAVGPAALLLERLRQVPVVEGQPGHDALRQQLVDEPGVEVQASGVDRSAVGPHARPGGGEAVGLQPQLGHQRDVVAVAVVVIARDVSVVATDHRAGHAAEGIPDRVGSAVFVGSAFDLVGRGCRAEEEGGRERTVSVCGHADRVLSEM